MGRIKVGKVSEISEGKLHKVSSDEGDILVTKVEGKFYAIDDTCAHQGASLSEGSMEGKTVKCGWHGAEFDCTTGELVKFAAKINDLKPYKIIQEQDDVFIER